MSVTPSFQRARRPEHKQQRRAAILAAARKLARRRGVRHVSLGDVATEAGMAKSNVLRYFETREEIYLQLTEEGLAESVRALGKRLGDEPATPLGVADALADTLIERPLFCDLLSQVSSTLEHNVSPELGRDFKLALGHLADDLAALLAAALPDLGEGPSAELVVGTFVLVAGLWPAAHPPPEIIAAIDPDAGHESLDFDAMLRRLLRALFVGLPDAG